MSEAGEAARWLVRWRSRGDAPALVYRDLVLAYRELAELTEAWSGRLDAAKIQRGSAVMLCGDMTPASLALFFALADRGCILLPQSPAARSQRDRHREIGCPQWLIEVDPLDEAVFTRLDAAPPPALYHLLGERQHPGLVVFSSGSSGKPKGIVHDLATLLASYGRGKPTRIAAFLLFDHIGGVDTMLRALGCGGCLVALRERTPDGVLAQVARHRVEILPTTPTFLRLMLISEAHKRHDLSSLRLVAYGTEPMAQIALAQLHEAIPGVKLGQTYGLSEVGVPQTRSESSDSLWMTLGGDGFQARVVDGVLQLRARTAMVGYLDALSPFTEDGWFVTGDLVEQQGDRLRIIGRASERINVGGEKLLPIEVEQVMLQVEGVEEVAVFGEPNPLMGQVVAARMRVAPGSDARAMRAKVLRFCREHLERYKVPVRIEVTEASMHNERFKKLRAR